MRSKVFVFVLSGAVWALAAGSAVFWLLRLAGMPLAAAPDASPASRLVSADGPPVALLSVPELAALLGQALPSAETAVSAPARFKLLGVVAEGRGGVALLALDDQPARPYRVGSRLDEITVLQAVGPRHVVLGTGEPGSGGQRLELAAE